MRQQTHNEPGFRLYLWSHRAVFIGHSPENELHRHHAAQLCISLDGNIRARADRTSPWIRAPAVLIPPDQAHEIDAGDNRILAIYWEPESIDYPFMRYEKRVQTYPLADKATASLDELLNAGMSADEAWARCELILDLPVRRPTGRMDQRIRQVVDAIRRSPSEPHSLESLATSVHLSPSRFRHLFTDIVGVSLRRFIIWTRSRVVVRSAVAGLSLTEAAYKAGFADSAHMSKTFRDMFGFAPSVLFAKRIPKTIVIVPDPP